MKQSRTKLAQTIADRSLKGGSNKKLAREVAAYLLAERRTSEIDSILRDVHADWSEAGYVEVLASSAHALTAGVKADVIKQVKRVYPDAKDIVVTEIIDPEVVGGVKLELPNQQLDLTIEAKLNKFKQLTMNGKD